MYLMEIVGIGTQIVECVRIGRMIQEHGELFLARVFTPKEMRHCRLRKNSTEHFAGQWAAKEAVLKALGMHSVKGLAWTDLEILHKAGQRSKVHLQGAIKDHADQKDVGEILVTLAHCRAYATAYAIALKA
jgi:holo-[acyl-carrier protein] synthase